MLTIVFYSINGPAAKALSRKIAAVKDSYVRVVDVSFWDGDYIKCDAVEIVPDIPGWQRKRIMKIYPGAKDAGEQEVINEPERKQMGLMPSKEPVNDVNEKKAVHRGGGRWFVMTGDDIISGPHNKVDAKRLAEETV